MKPAPRKKKNHKPIVTYSGFREIAKTGRVGTERNRGAAAEKMEIGGGKSNEGKR